MDEVKMLRRLQLYMALIGLALAAGAITSHALDAPDKGKNARELFRTNCAICHHSVRGLGASMGSWTLSGFLAEHYTTSKAGASVLANYLIAVGKAERETQPRRRTRPNRPRPPTFN